MEKLPFNDFVLLNLLLSVEQLGPTKILALYAKFQGFENIFNATKSELCQVEYIGENLAQRIQRAGEKSEIIKSEVEAEIEKINKINARYFTYWDSDYPDMLRNIYYPPLILYTLGKSSKKDKYSIAIVGTRKPTNYGKKEAERFSSYLASQGITIVSGLARGIDTIAHKSSLQVQGRTIAVTGAGLDYIYPPENKKLYHEIVNNGIVISEFKLGTKSDAKNFPQRNRIISGLSLGTVIVETRIQGGAMQTAAHTTDQNRELFAIPGNNLIEQSEGPNLLIQKGEAKLVINPEDVLTELELKLKPIIGKTIPKPTFDLNMFEQKILSVLNQEPIYIDKIASLTSFSTSDCLVHLLSLEFKGLIRQLPGKTFSLL
ncbi:MAG: DNA-processing protein DprA [Ignavibacteriales bacterium]|nr:DNA-processing protein DprA [Ignavibacteriales bacterium]